MYINSLHLIFIFVPEVLFSELFLNVIYCFSVIHVLFGVFAFMVTFYSTFQSSSSNTFELTYKFYWNIPSIFISAFSNIWQYQILRLVGLIHHLYAFLKLHRYYDWSKRFTQDLSFKGPGLFYLFSFLYFYLGVILVSNLCA